VEIKPRITDPILAHHNSFTPITMML